jgi:hypothetical protein
VCHGHKRNIITDLLLTGVFLIISIIVTGTLFRLTRDLNQGFNFNFAPHQCEDRSLSNLPLWGNRLSSFYKNIQSKKKYLCKKKFSIATFFNVTFNFWAWHFNWFLQPPTSNENNIFEIPFDGLIYFQ